MPTWLAIAIPSVVAVASILMWALDYSKKAHEIQKLRLELEKLKWDRETAERAEAHRSSGLYTPTAEEVDRVLSSQRRKATVAPPFPGAGITYSSGGAWRNSRSNCASRCRVGDLWHRPARA